MSERFPDHKRLTIASMAHDIILHHSQTITDPEDEHVFLKADWEGHGTGDQIWYASLTSDGLYRSSYYAVALRSSISSEIHRYKYDVTRNKFTYEHPLGKEVESDEEYIAQSMFGWMTLNEGRGYIKYDAEGVRLAEQGEFAKISARVALSEVLATSEGIALFHKLRSTWDTELSNELYQEFYALSRRSDDSFYIGAAATRAALEVIVEASRPRQLPASQSEIIDDVN